MARKVIPVKSPNIRRKTTKEMLPVHFTEAELQSIGLSLAATHQHIGKLTTVNKMSADRYKEDIEAATNEAGRLAMNRVNGYENRYVDCEVTYDFEKGMKKVVRLDTGEVVRYSLSELAVVRNNAAIASETAQFQEVSAALRNHADGTETADLNALADKIDASIAKVKGIVPDAPATGDTPPTT